MIDPNVRRADGDVAGQLGWLEAEARASLVDQRGGARWLDTHPARHVGWADVIAEHHVFIAHIDAVVVGYLVLAVEPPLARVDEVYVTPQARELGFGDALLEAATEAAHAEDCSLLEGTSLPGDRDTKNLYERAGIKARLITVSTEI